jgi:hypothetical protein
MKMTESEYERMRKVYLGGELGDGRVYSPLVKKGWLEGEAATGCLEMTALGRRYFVAEQRRRFYGRQK